MQASSRPARTLSRRRLCTLRTLRRQMRPVPSSNGLAQDAPLRLQGAGCGSTAIHDPSWLTYLLSGGLQERPAYRSAVRWQRWSRLVLGWPSLVVAGGSALYAIVSWDLGNGNQALVLASMAAVDGVIAATVLLRQPWS